MEAKINRDEGQSTEAARNGTETKLWIGKEHIASGSVKKKKTHKE